MNEEKFALDTPLNLSEKKMMGLPSSEVLNNVYIRENNCKFFYKINNLLSLGLQMMASKRFERIEQMINIANFFPLLLNHLFSVVKIFNFM